MDQQKKLPSFVESLSSGPEPMELCESDDESRVPTETKSTATNTEGDITYSTACPQSGGQSTQTDAERKMTKDKMLEYREASRNSRTSNAVVKNDWGSMYTWSAKGSGYSSGLLSKGRGRIAKRSKQTLRKNPTPRDNGSGASSSFQSSGFVEPEEEGGSPKSLRAVDPEDTQADSETGNTDVNMP